MNRLNGLTAVATVASISLIAVNSAHADDEQILDACIQQFVTANFAGFQGKLSVRKEIARTSLPLTASNHFVITVSATDPVHGTELATADCRVSQGGKIVSLKPTHVASKMTFTAHVHKDKSPVVADTQANNAEDRND